MGEISEIQKNYVKGWGNSVFGIGNSLCKGCEARVCLVYLRKSKGVCVAAEEQGRQWGHTSEGSVDPVRTLALI